MPNIRILSKAVLQIFCSQGCSYTKCLCLKKGNKPTKNFQNRFKGLSIHLHLGLLLYAQYQNPSQTHTCQVLGKSKSEIARAPLIFAYNLVIERAEKSGAQVLRVRFFSLFKQT